MHTNLMFAFSHSASTELVQKQLVEASNLVVSMLMSIQGLWNIGMSAEFVSSKKT